MRCWILLACLGCGEVEGDKKVDAAINRDSPGPDSPMIDAPAPPCDLSKPFGAPVLIPGVNTANNERFPFFSSDELTIYFSSYPTNRQIMTATRLTPTSTFSTPIELAGVNTTVNDEHPSITSNGLLLFAETNNFGSTVDIVVASRSSTSADFGAFSLVSGVNTTNFQEVDAIVSGDGLSIMFGSNRNGDYEIFRATRSSLTTAFGTPVDLPELDSTATDSNPVISADGLEIFFSTDRDAGNTQVYRATRATASGAFGAPAAVAELNTTNVDIPSWLSPDRCRLLLTSDRLGPYDMYIATRPQ